VTVVSNGPRRRFRDWIGTTSGEERVLGPWRHRWSVGSVDADLASPLSRHKDATIVLQFLLRSPIAMTTEGVDIVIESGSQRSLVVFNACQYWEWSLVDCLFSNSSNGGVKESINAGRI
jgi:hypothetical protein